MAEKTPLVCPSCGFVSVFTRPPCAIYRCAECGIVHDVPAINSRTYSQAHTERREGETDR